MKFQSCTIANVGIFLRRLRVFHYTSCVIKCCVAYKRAAFDVIQADAITLAPYMGLDSVKPFSENKSKGCFVLCKTSNPSSKDMQELTVNGQYLYQHVAKLADDWNENNNIGLVVGATDVEVEVYTVD